MYISAPLSVQNVLVTLVDSTVNITWSPPSITNGMILQYIIQKINSSGKSYHHISGNQNYLELPYFNDALVFVAAVNQYGQSSFELAKPSGKKNVWLLCININHIYIQLLVCRLLVLIMEHVLL